jgi:hypothetical protein
MSDTDTETVALRVASSVKERWEQEAEESPEYDSLSHLIRLSVQKEIEGKHAEIGTGADAGTDTETSQEVLSAINTLRGEMEDIRTQLGDVTREVEAMGRESPARNVVFDALPRASETNPQEPAEAGLTPMEISEQVDREVPAVARACRELSEAVTVVKRAESEDTERYWVAE